MKIRIAVAWLLVHNINKKLAFYQNASGFSCAQTSIVFFVFFVCVVFFATPYFAYAAPLYAPGETLNPACEPTDADCTIGPIPVPLGGSGLSSIAVGLIPFGAGSSDFATSSALSFDGATEHLAVTNASTTNLTITSLQNALLSTDGDGLVTATSSIPTALMPLTHGYVYRGSSENTAQATSALFVSDSGDVGIGTDIPDEKLHVYGTGRFDSDGNTPSSDISAGVFITGGAGVSELAINSEGANPDISLFEDANKRAQLVYDTTLNGLSISISDTFIGSGGLNTHDLFIASDGNVGIGGNTNPSTALDVDGVITATGGNSTNWQTAFGWGDHSGEGYLVSTSNLSDLDNATTSRDNLGLGNLAVLDNLSTFTTTDLAQGNNLYSQWSNSGSDIYFDSGKVGIGTDTPTYQLDIEETDGSTDSVVSIVHTGNRNAALELENSNNTWRLSNGINTGNIILYDATNTTLPFQIEPAAPDNAVYVNTSGGVGINTDTIGDGARNTLLHIYGEGTGVSGRTDFMVENTATDSASSFRLVNSSGNSFSFQLSGPDYSIGEQASVGPAQAIDLVFGTNGNTLSGGSGDIIFRPGGYGDVQKSVWFKPDGNVTIGTDTAVDYITIVKNQNAQTALSIDNGTDGASAFTTFKAINNADNNVRLGITATSANFTNDAFDGGVGFLDTTGAAFNIVSNGSTGDFNFFAGGTSNSDIALHIDGSTGYIGMGTNSPDSKIHALDGTVAEFRFNSGASDVTPTIAVGNIDAGGKFGSLIAGTNGAAFIFDSAGYFAISGQPKTDYTNNNLGAGATEYLRIDGSTGYIGFNETSPDTLLHYTGGNLRGEDGTIGITQLDGSQADRITNPATSLPNFITYSSAFDDQAKVGLWIAQSWTSGTVSNANHRNFGLNAFAYLEGSTDASITASGFNAVGGRYGVRVNDTAQAHTIAGVAAYNWHQGSGTVTNSYHYYSEGESVDVSTGLTITNLHHFRADSIPSVDGTVTNQYGVYVPTLSNATNNYAAYFEDNVGIGQTNPGVKLHIGEAGVVDGTDLLRLQDANSTCNFDADTGTPSCGSDETLKKNINSLDTKVLLAKVDALRPVSYQWKTDDDAAGLQYGFIAQEVEGQFPELVSEKEWVDGTQRKFLNIGGMMPYVVGALKSLYSELLSLVDRITGAEARINELELRLQALEESTGNSYKPPSPAPPIQTQEEVHHEDEDTKEQNEETEPVEETIDITEKSAPTETHKEVTDEEADSDKAAPQTNEETIPESKPETKE